MLNTALSPPPSVLHCSVRTVHDGTTSTKDARITTEPIPAATPPTRPTTAGDILRSAFHQHVINRLGDALETDTDAVRLPSHTGAVTDACGQAEARPGPSEQEAVRPARGILQTLPARRSKTLISTTRLHPTTPFFLN